MGKNTTLRAMRFENGDLTQSEAARLANVSITEYNMVENGVKVGRFNFWHKIQRAFGVPDSEMWRMVKNDAACKEPKGHDADS